jgi:enoyl-[acyl-carrier-protein] reductase (NADH)
LGIESTGEDIANGVFYLGTDLSKTVTGSELAIDSGLLNSLLPYKEMCK